MYVYICVYMCIYTHIYMYMLNIQQHQLSARSPPTSFKTVDMKSTQIL